MWWHRLNHGFQHRIECMDKGEDKCLSKIDTFIRKIHLFLSALFEQIVPESKSPLNRNIYLNFAVILCSWVLPSFHLDKLRGLRYFQWTLFKTSVRNSSCLAMLNCEGSIENRSLSCNSLSENPDPECAGLCFSILSASLKCKGR